MGKYLVLNTISRWQMGFKVAYVVQNIVRGLKIMQPGSRHLNLYNVLVLAGLLFACLPLRLLNAEEIQEALDTQEQLNIARLLYKTKLSAVSSAERQGQTGTWLRSPNSLKAEYENILEIIELQSSQQRERQAGNARLQALVRDLQGLSEEALIVRLKELDSKTREQLLTLPEGRQVFARILSALPGNGGRPNLIRSPETSRIISKRSRAQAPSMANDLSIQLIDLFFISRSQPRSWLERRIAELDSSAQGNAAGFADKLRSIYRRALQVSEVEASRTLRTVPELVSALDFDPEIEPPISLDLRHLVPPVSLQGNSFACSAFAISTVMASDPQVKRGISVRDLYTRFLTHQLPEIDRHSDIGVGSVVEAMLIASENSFVAESVAPWPDRLPAIWTASEYPRAGELYQIEDFYSVSESEFIRTENLLRRLLAQDPPIFPVVLINTDAMYPSDVRPDWGQLTLQGANANHVFTVIGFDKGYNPFTDQNERYFIVHNSLAEHPFPIFISEANLYQHLLGILVITGVEVIHE